MAAQRPPATSAAVGNGGNAPRPRILRIGVLLGGKIVEERLIRERVPVSLGQSMQNTFSIPIEGLPLQFTLFAIDQGKYSLRFLPKMDGRLSDGGQVNTLDALKARGASNVGDYWQVPVGDGSRGKLTLGDLTVLFQFVTEPPRQPKPMLPASVRGTFADRFDPRLLVILAISLLVNSILVFSAFFIIDPDVDGSDAERAYEQTFKPETFDVALDQPKPKPVDAVGSAAGSAVAPKPADKPSPTKPSTKPDDGGGRNPNAAVSVSDQQATAFINALTGDADPNGHSDQDMHNRAPGTTLGQEIADARETGRTASVGNSGHGGTRDGGGPRVGVGGGPALHGPGGTESAGGPPRESGPSGRISVSDKKAFDDSTLTPDVVLSKILAAYLPGIKRCYKEYLKKDASARGKVLLEFGVSESGRLVSGKASGVATEVSSCIQNLMGTWRFPTPKDKDGSATTASFAITLQLVPD